MEAVAGETEANPNPNPNRSSLSLSISGALSTTPTDSPSPSPLLPQDDQDDQPPAQARSTRRASLQAPGPIQHSLPTSQQPTIPGSPTPTPATPQPPPPATMTSTSPNRVGPGQPLLIEFLLISGKRIRWIVGDSATVREVREAVWTGWPQEWRGLEDSPPSAESLRLLYLGKFLDDKRTLGFYGIVPPVSTPSPPAPTSSSSSSAPPPPTPPPAPTIIHLNIRPLATEGDYDDDLLKPQKSSSMCASCCVVS